MITLPTEQDNSYGHEGIALISQERDRQIHKKGFGKAHDLNYSSQNFIDAADCYILSAAVGNEEAAMYVDPLWPWNLNSFHPENKLRNLVKAGALIAAAIDRLLVEEQNKGK